MEIKERGTLLFQCRNGDQWLLHDVYYIPRLRSNLISLGQLTEAGHKVIMDDNWLEVYDKVRQKLVLRVSRTANRLYQAELRSSEPVCLMARVSE